jgi:uncharacterized membrane protein YhaH (DUF805 family)
MRFSSLPDAVHGHESVAHFGQVVNVRATWESAVLFLLTPYGRVSRRGFWLGYVALFIWLFVGARLADAATRLELPKDSSLLEPFAWAIELAGGPFTLAVFVLLPWITAMMILKRLHDRGFGGMMLLWKLALLIGLAWVAFNAHALAPPPWGGVLEIVCGGVALLMLLRVLAIVMFFGGQEGDNPFGSDPLAI